MKERLQKYMALCGVASRRKSEEIISQGRVKVNGNVTKEVVIIDTEKDLVEVDGEKIYIEEKKVYIILNKPEGVVTTVKDQFGRKAVTDIIDISQRIYPVGRLDYETSGLLILTNDGDITNKMTHPSHEVNKVYLAHIKGIPKEIEIEEFKKGLLIDDYKTAPADFEIIKKDTAKSRCTARITIHEGRNRQVRKMCRAIGHPVLKLMRISIGKINLGNLKPGEWRYMIDEEIEYIKSI